MGDKKRFSSCTSWKFIVHVMDVIWLTAILLVQGTVLNYYIIDHYSTSVTPYFLFVADFLCLGTFIGALATSYNFLRRVAAQDFSGYSVSLRREKRKVSQLGLLPLSYVSWLFYVSILVAKILIIFTSKPLLRSLNPENHFGPQLLKVAMGLSGIVFLLLLEGHNFVKRGTPRYSFITSICAKTGIELFDSVAFLSILIDDKPAGFPSSVEDFILGIATCNFFLPALKLYQLSFPDKTIDRRSLVIAVGYYVLHLLLVDIPFLAVRLYLWLAFRDNASMFLMKNVLSIILTLRGMYPDLITLSKGYWGFVKSPKGRRGLQKEKEDGQFEEITLPEMQKGEPV